MRSRGFTVIELLIVIVIIGILATLTIIAFTGIQQRAQVAAMQTDLKQSAGQLEIYRYSTSTSENYPLQNDCSVTPVPDSICLSSSGSSTYQYTANNSTNPPSFCITLTQGETSYYVSNTSSVTAGACPGHIANGQYGALPVGTSIEGYWTTPPDGYLSEDGSAVSRTVYSDLFAVIGTTYGSGDGSTTFNLPDSRGKVAVNINSGDSEFSTLGQTIGSKTATVSIAQMPAHTHRLAYRTTDVADWLGGSGNPYGVAPSYNTRSGDYGSLETTGGGQSHNNIQPSIVKSYAIKYSAPTGSSSLQEATSIEGYWTNAPQDYLLEDGSAVSRSTYSALFSVIGTTYGSGDGSTTFNLPDSRGRVAVNMSTSDTEFDTIGEKTGAKTETLTIAQMPAHTHRLAYLTTDVADWLGGSGNPYGISTSYATRSGTYSSLETVGGGQPHDNIQPSIVKTFAIKYTVPTSSDEYVAKGTSIEGYWVSAPAGYLFEDGSAVSRSIYSDLFAAVGTAYGSGDGSTTFNLPDSRARVGVNISTTDAEFDTMGEKNGAKTETLTVSQIPAHTHRLAFLTTDVPDWTGGSGNPYGISTNYNVRSGSYDSTETVGDEQPHNNIQPSIVKRFAIKF
jgi:prepilin-type N-terminal cleavage/methylation domain-containing protein